MGLERLLLAMATERQTTRQTSHSTSYNADIYRQTSHQTDYPSRYTSYTRFTWTEGRHNTQTTWQVADGYGTRQTQQWTWDAVWVPGDDYRRHTYSRKPDGTYTQWWTIDPSIPPGGHWTDANKRWTYFETTYTKYRNTSRQTYTYYRERTFAGYTSRHTSGGRGYTSYNTWVGQRQTTKTTSYSTEWSTEE